MPVLLFTLLCTHRLLLLASVLVWACLPVQVTCGVSAALLQAAVIDTAATPPSPSITRGSGCTAAETILGRTVDVVASHARGASVRYLRSIEAAGDHAGDCARRCCEVAECTCALYDTIEYVKPIDSQYHESDANESTTELIRQAFNCFLINCGPRADSCVLAPSRFMNFVRVKRITNVSTHHSPKNQEKNPPDHGYKIYKHMGSNTEVENHIEVTQQLSSNDKSTISSSSVALIVIASLLCFVLAVACFTYGSKKIKDMRRRHQYTKVDLLLEDQGD